MAKYLVQHRRGTVDDWASNDTLIPEEGEIVIEIDKANSLHRLKIGDGVHAYADLAYLMAGDEIVTQVLAQTRPRVVTVELTTEWTKVADSDYSQTLALENITEHSRLDLQPSADMIAEFKQLGLVFVAENNAGVITIHSIGNIPSKPYTIQATIIETECDGQNTSVIGIPVGAPAPQVDWEQTDETKSDYIKNKPDIEGIVSEAMQGVTTFIRYSAYPDGTGLTEEWTGGQSYIGFATGTTAPTDKEAYKWSLFVGEGTTTTVVQTTGDSETTVMSQKAVTDFVENTTANALVGEKLGRTISLDDVSPLEHKIPVTLRSKNLTYNCIYNDVAVGNTAAAVISGVVTFEKGKTYTISFDTENTGAMLALSISTAVATAIDSRYPIADGTRKSVTLTALVDYVRPQGVTIFQLANSSTANSGLCSNLQIEESPVATPYAPYTPDDTVVTVKSCGKNLLPVSRVTPEVSNEKNLLPSPITGTFTISYDFNLTGYNPNDASVLRLTTSKGDIGTTRHANSKTLDNITITGVYFANYFAAKGGSLDNIQLEVGTAKTEFEPYKEGETIITTPSESTELTSISPNMTIYTDNAGAVVEAKYNKDTNIVIEKLIQAIISLGGNI